MHSATISPAAYIDRVVEDNVCTKYVGLALGDDEFDGGYVGAYVGNSLGR